MDLGDDIPAVTIAGQCPATFKIAKACCEIRLMAGIQKQFPLRIHKTIADREAGNRVIPHQAPGVVTLHGNAQDDVPPGVSYIQPDSALRCRLVKPGRSGSMAPRLMKMLTPREQ